MQNWLEKQWRKNNFVTKLLQPISYVYLFFIRLRKKRIKPIAVSKPVIIIGNISVGGSGKTPVVIALCEHLKNNNYKPGIISRGYKSNAPEYPYQITGESDPEHSGDEPLLIFHKTQCPVVIGPDRVACAEYLLEHNDVNIILSDDGLQHYRLHRDIEIAVVSQKSVGNKLCLPAGPLREPLSRLDSVDIILDNTIKIIPNYIYAITNKIKYINKINILDFEPKKIHAIAGIAHPERFFNLLKQQGFEIIEHAYPDHYCFTKSDFDDKKQFPVVMTEKDAVKCGRLDHCNLYALSISAMLPEEFYTQIDHLLHRT